MIYLSILVASIVGFGLISMSGNKTSTTKRSKDPQRIKITNQQDIAFLNMVSMEGSTVTGTTFPSGFKSPTNGKWTVKKIDNEWNLVQLN